MILSSLPVYSHCFDKFVKYISYKTLSLVLGDLKSDIIQLYIAVMPICL